MGEKTVGYGYQINRLAKKGGAYLKENGLGATIKHMADRNEKARIYSAYLKGRTLSEYELNLQRESNLDGPLFSVVVPLFNTDGDMLAALIKSWREQTYGRFELCFADASFMNDLQMVVDEAGEGDPRIKYSHLDMNYGISGNTNEAIKMSTGDYIVFCDHDDIVAPDTLYNIAKRLLKRPEIEVFYTDQDKVDSVGKKFYEPFLKPSFDPYFICGTNYICHLFVVKRSILDQERPLHKEYDGSQDYDLTLRALEKAKMVCHIPSISYRWRISGTSVADDGKQKMYAYEAGRKAIQAHYDRIGVKAEVSMLEGTLGVYRTKYEIPADFEDKIIHVAVVGGFLDKIELEKAFADEREYILFKANYVKHNVKTLAELFGYVYAGGAAACGGVPDYPFTLPLTDMNKVDVSAFYLTVCANASMPVKGDYLLVKKAALSEETKQMLIDNASDDWHRALRDALKKAGKYTVYNPFALGIEPVRM